MSKHRTSGDSGMHNAAKQQMSRDANRVLDEVAEIRQRRRRLYRTYKSVRDLFTSWREGGES